MARPITTLSSPVLVALLLAAGHPLYASDLHSALPELPIADCGKETARTASWHAVRSLDEAARRWALGAELSDAVARSGYTAERSRDFVSTDLMRRTGPL